MRGQPDGEELLDEVWRVVEELKRWTEGLEESLLAARAKRNGDRDGSHD